MALSPVLISDPFSCYGIIFKIARTIAQNSKQLKQISPLEEKRRGRPRKDTKSDKIVPFKKQHVSHKHYPDCLSIIVKGKATFATLPQDQRTCRSLLSKFQAQQKKNCSICHQAKRIITWWYKMSESVCWTTFSHSSWVF